MAANTTRHLTVSMAAETAAARSRAPVRFLAKIEGMANETGTEWSTLAKRSRLLKGAKTLGGEWKGVKKMTKGTAGGNMELHDLKLLANTIR